MNFTDRAVNSLLGLQRFIQAIEGVLIDLVAMVVPWASPLLPAFLTWQAMTERLRFPTWLAFACAGVVELLGLATINTAFLFWQFNKDARKSDNRAPVILAILVSCFYLAVVLITNTMLDQDPLIYKIAKGLLSSLSVIGGVTIALRASHAKRLQSIREEKQERKVMRQIRQVARNSLHDVDMIPQSGQNALQDKLDWRRLPDEHKERVKGMAVYDIVTEFGIKERTARNWQVLAARNGRGVLS